MSLDEWVWFGFRAFDCVGAVVVSVMFWRNTRRRSAAGKLDDETVELRFAMLTYFFGTGLLYGRALIVGSPAGPHLALIAIPLAWTLIALLRSERSYRKAQR